MFDKLDAIEERFELVSRKISDPEVMRDMDAWRGYCKEHADLTPIVEKYREYKTAKKNGGGRPRNACRGAGQGA